MFSILPPEVISNHVFPFLRFHDLLRLRRVSKVSKEMSEEYLRVYGTSKRFIVINVEEDSDDLTRFLALPFSVPVSRLYISSEDNSSWGSEHYHWDSERMQTFLRLYGEKITYLHISTLVIPIESPTLVQFFEGLPNLEELRIYWLEGDKAHVEEPGPDLNLPSTFKRLKNLHVRFYSCRLQLLKNFLNECSVHLESINHPRYRYFQWSPVPGIAFDIVRQIVETRHEQDLGAPNLKYFDLDDLEYEDARRFYSLVTTCSTHNVKLQHVNARLIEAMMKLDTPDRGLHGDKISRCVVSIRNINTSMFLLELPVLEKIDMKHTSYCAMPEGDFEAPQWGKLRELKLWVDSEYLYKDGNDEGDNVSSLFQFFFHGIRRENMESLELLFEKDEILSHPNMTDVFVSCPNLKKLYIYNWPGSACDFAQLWGNLCLLEDATFERCESLRDSAFIGDDITRPALLKATRLKSLSLKYSDKRPGITDALFHSALRHMPLKALHLTSYNSHCSFTLDGLESLLTGKFAETIEEFPLKWGIKLKDVTAEQLAELDGKFRSAHM